MEGIRSAYREHERVTLDFKEKSRAKQSFKDECDINNIMKKYEKTGLVAHTARYQGRYEDVTTAVDLHTAMDICASAEEAFMSLPASIRKRFENDAGKFLDFVQDPENLEEVRSMGLGRPPEKPSVSEAIKELAEKVAPVEPPAGA